MSPSASTVFQVSVAPDGALVLRGELDMATVQDLQDTIDQVIVPGQSYRVRHGSADLHGQHRDQLHDPDLHGDRPPRRAEGCVPGGSAPVGSARRAGSPSRLGVRGRRARLTAAPDPS